MLNPTPVVKIMIHEFITNNKDWIILGVSVMALALLILWKDGNL